MLKVKINTIQEISVTQYLKPNVQIVLFLETSIVKGQITLGL